MTTGSSSGDHLQGALGRVLRWASRSEVHEVLHGRHDQPLSATDVWLLDAVVTTGATRISDLAAWQGVDRSTVTPQVRRLESRGLVERRVDEQDRRAVLLVATERGRDLHRTLAEDRGRYLDAQLAHWSASDRQALATLLARFADDLDSRPRDRTRPD